jgi:hypothetical protein
LIGQNRIRRHVMRFVVRLVFMACLAALAARAGATEFTSLDALIKHYDSAPCRECHIKIHEEWASSFHSGSVVRSLGSIRAFVTHLEKERKAPVDKTQMLKCLDCHAPMVNDASEDVIKEIAQLVKTAVDGKNDFSKKAARKKLSGLSVNCAGCHTVKATANPITPPDPNILYGPKGGGGTPPCSGHSCDPIIGFL